MASKGQSSLKLECAICGSKEAFRCGGCEKVSYCSKSHQKSHWKNHKGECQAWKICESPELGRYLTAARNVKQGEIILQESALVVCPPRVTLPVCLGCYTEFEEDDEPSGNNG